MEMNPSNQAPVRKGSRQRPEPARVNHRPDEILDDLRESIERNVAVGLMPEHEIVSQMLDLFSERCDTKALRFEAERMARAAVERHEIRQGTWPTTTLRPARCGLRRAGSVGYPLPTGLRAL